MARFLKINVNFPVHFKTYAKNATCAEKLPIFYFG